MRNFLAVIAAVHIASAPAPAVEAQPAGAAVPAITVVRKWGDMLAQPIIDLGGGVRVRLGLESATAAAGSGVLIYCLAEGFTVPKSGSGDDHLGPLHVSMAVDGVQGAQLGVAWARDLGETPPDARAVPLFARMIAIVKPATYVVTIADAQGRPVATASVVATTMDPAPWSTVGTSRSAKEDEPAAAPSEGPSSTVATFGFNGSFRAVPTWDGFQPLEWYQPSRDGQMLQPLPRLLPATPDARLKLTRTGGRLVIDSAVPLMVGGGSLPFLMRWWVNDRPLPALAANQQERSGGIFVEVSQLVLDGDLDPAVLNAKAGDRIGVQFLYCPNGWKRCDLHTWEELARLVMARSDLPATLLSNRIDFTLP